jgi:hypothetical protein
MAMIRLLVSAVIYLVANAIGLLVANALLDDMSVDGSAFVVAVLIFTGVEVLVQPLISDRRQERQRPRRQLGADRDADQADRDRRRVARA